MTIDAPTQNLIETMVSEFVTSGQLMLPPGRRDEVVALLTRLVVNDEFRDAYCRVVTATRERLGMDVATAEAADSGDIPDVEIARHGFGGLADAQLADYAVSPAAIEAIADGLYDDDLLPELGGWFVEAGMREVTVTPEDVERTAEMLRNPKLDE